MKKAIITGPRQAELVDAPDPRPVEDWALVKIHATPMCTEYKAFVAGSRAEYLGHEAAGEVVEVAQPGRVKVGDRVVVMPMWPCGKCSLCIAGDYIHCEHTIDVSQFTGGREGSATYAQYLLKPAWLLPLIPDDVSYELASLSLCGLGPSFGAFEAMNVNAFDTVLITGAGPVGLGAVINAKYRGARVIVAESIPYRVERARLLRADYVVDPRAGDALAQICAITGGVGVDKALDCAGVVAAQRLCIDATRRKGQVAFVGECNDELPIRVSPDMIRKGLTLIGSWHYNLAYTPQIMQVIRGSPVIQHLISHVLPMSRVQDALELSASQQNAKIILKPWE
jgi:threonine dehydrogenase-like Zn-dependent dehydrogenase